FDIEYSLSFHPDVVLTHLSAQDVQLIASAPSDLRLLVASLPGVQVFTQPHMTALARNATFQRDYLPQPIPVRFLLERGAVYLAPNARVTSAPTEWRSPVIDD